MGLCISYLDRICWVEFNSKSARVPTKVKENTVFPFEVGDPCLVEIDRDGGGLKVKPISVEDAVELGWQERRRRK